MVAAVKIPVTVKIRTGWDEENINAELITEIAEAAGAKAICVHGRTREQAYRGPANWDHIKACKKRAKSIKVIGNGDLFDASAAIKMFEYTGCDAVLISRGTMGQPWIAEDIYQLQNGLPPTPRTAVDSCQALLDHFHLMASYYPEKKVVMEMRRVGCWYIKGTFGAREFREALNKAQTLEELKAILAKITDQIQDTLLSE
jgi:nifR3 family TIM-barrel protein